ncbi:MAG: HAD-IIB family hydrolase [Lachnospiraceae bacterium]
MKKSALFFDIDGTLTNNHTGIIQRSALEAILKAKENGHLVFINTGRTICSIQHEIKKFEFDGFLCGCGTYLLFQDEVLLHYYVNMKRSKEIVEKMSICKIDAVLEATEDLYFTAVSSRFNGIERMRDRYGKMGLGHKIVSKETVEMFDKLFIFTDSYSDVKNFFDDIGRDMDIIDRERGRYEIVPKGFSKATAIDFIRQKFAMDMDQIYVFGDSANDLPMFEYAVHTIAVGEHSESLDPYTEFVTKNVEEDGIEFAIKKYGLI